MDKKKFKISVVVDNEFQFEKVFDNEKRCDELLQPMLGCAYNDGKKSCSVIYTVIHK